MVVQMKQSEAVKQALANVCGEVEGAYNPTKEERAQVAQILFEGFKAGTIALKPAFDEKYVRGYIPGLISNWLRKDSSLNGGVKYVPKNPGSRVGSSDPQVRALRTLLSTKTDPAERAEIQSFITQRLAELKPAKATLTPEQIELLKASGLEHLITE